MGKFYGINDYSQLPGEVDWDPRRGPAITQIFRGTPGSIDTLETQFLINKTRYRRQADRDGGYNTITATLGAEATQPADQPLADLWDLDDNDIEESLWNLPRVKALFDALLDTDGNPTNQYTSVRQDIQNMVNGTTLLSDVGWWSTASADMKAFVHELLLGRDAYFISQTVLRRRTVIALNSTIRPNRSNVNKVFPTTESLQTIEGVPALPFDLPEGAWLKKGPKRQQIAADKWQILQEWWWGDSISTFAYDTAS